MPKSKIHSGASKRFRVTGSGRLVRQRAGTRHLLEHKPSGKVRALSGLAPVAAADTRKIRKLLGR